MDGECFFIPKNGDFEVNIDDECLFESFEQRNDIENARKKFEGQKYLDPRCDPAFRALLDSDIASSLISVPELRLENECQSLQSVLCGQGRLRSHFYEK